MNQLIPAGRSVFSNLNMRHMLYLVLMSRASCRPSLYILLSSEFCFDILVKSRRVRFPMTRQETSVDLHQCFSLVCLLC